MSEKEDTFLTRIRDLLAEEPYGTGAFEEIAVIDGQQVVHRFSLSVGFGSQFARTKYVKKFGDLPDWVLPLHPVHRWGLCRLAVREERSLPANWPG